MENYKEMYLKLFNEVTKTIEILEKAQIDTEAMFMSLEDSNKEEKESL